jgi:hypothetical protein
MAFGAGGPHYCLGASLAKLELKVMFEGLVKRLPDIEATGPPERLRNNLPQLHQASAGEVHAVEPGAGPTDSFYLRTACTIRRGTPALNPSVRLAKNER